MNVYLWEFYSYVFDFLYLFIKYVCMFLFLCVYLRI